MKEAFEIMSTHPLLTLFLGVVFVFVFGITCSTISDVFGKTYDEDDEE